MTATKTALAGALLLALCLAPGALAQLPDEVRDIKEQVWRVEQQRVEALVMENWKSLETLLSEELTYTHSDGATEDKDQFLRNLRTGAMTYLSMQHQDVLVRLYGEAAVLTGTSQVRVRRAKGEPTDARLRVTMVYANEEGWWRLVAWQSTRLPQ